jgi:Flp pilus assembly protein TadG
MRGQTLVEFALVAPLFLLLVCAMADFGRMFYVQMTLQNAVRQAGRFAMTGNHLPDPNNPGKYLSRVQSVIQTAQQAALGLNVTNIQINGQGNCTGVGSTCSAGGPGTPVTISLTTNLQLITPVISHYFGSNGVYQFTVSVTFQNQPFPPGSTT